MTFKKIVIGAFLLSSLAAGAAYAAYGNPRHAVEFYKGHTHLDGITTGAPQHSGGTDKFGCHNASVPYHCH